jgi:hypothetical protein
VCVLNPADAIRAKGCAGMRWLGREWIRVTMLLVGVGAVVSTLVLALWGPAVPAREFWVAPACSRATVYSASLDCVYQVDGKVETTWDATYQNSGETDYYYYMYVSIDRPVNPLAYINKKIYRAAVPGSKVTVGLWQGSIASVTLDGLTDKTGLQFPKGIWFCWALVCWAGVGLILRALIAESVLPKTIRSVITGWGLWFTQGAITAVLAISLIDAPYVGWKQITVDALIWVLGALVVYYIRYTSRFIFWLLERS